MSAQAWQVTRETRQQIANAVGGSAWGAGVIVPTASGGERYARLGDWVVLLSSGSAVTVPEQAMSRARHLLRARCSVNKV